MNSTAIILLSCLLVLCVQGQAGNTSRKCKCLNGYIGRVNTQLIKSEPLVYQPSNFCPKLEIIIVLGNKEKCVNPESKLGLLILTNKSRQERNRTASTTTASQTNTGSSTSL